MKLKCLVVDDEPIARQGMEEYVRETPVLEYAGSCENALMAKVFLQQQRVDLLLLDINMPHLTGIEFLKSLPNPPLVIFTTAHPEHALEGYSLDVVDYLVKPIVYARFEKAIQKAFEYHTLTTLAAPATEYFFIKCDQVYEKVFFRDVLYAEAMQNYCILHTPARKLITYVTLSGLAERLPAQLFMKVHKSYIVNLEQVTAVNGNDLFIGKAHIPVSRVLKEEVMNKVMGNNLFKR
jgi:DNA-binding LytR/AlgR family response regulator